jgi:N-acetylneuraminate synthase
MLMIIDRNLSNYIVYCEESILEALKKISKNDGRIVFSVDERGVLYGVMTNGDFRRWIAGNPTFDVTRPIGPIQNKAYKWAFVDDAPETIVGLMGSHTCLPLLDRHQHLVAVARRDAMAEIKIGNHGITSGGRVFTIAEIGINHNGQISLAKEMIDRAADAGADCAKFQMRNLDTLFRKAASNDRVSEDLGAQYTLSLLEKFKLTPDEMFEAFDHCKKRGIIPLCTPWDVESLAALEQYGMDAYKVASADLTNHDLLTAMAKTGKALICSTGMSMEAEIIEAVDLLRTHAARFVLLHCNSTYPAPFKDVNLRYMERLKEIGNCPVGYSGHERGWSVVLAAVGMGAKVIEKHFTLDREMEGSDHKISLLPDEFRQMVEGIRQVEAATGSAAERKMTQGELMNRNTLAKSLVINRDLPQGEVITEVMIDVKSPGRGVQPNRRAELIGKTARRPFRKGDFFFASDIEENAVVPRNYTFKREWGIPIRYHDFQRMMRKSNPDFLEFHFSFKDLDEEIAPFFPEPLDYNLVVHSPDLFHGDHLLNLCTEDKEYRRRSIAELQRVLDITRSLKKYFPKAADRTIVIASLGGFSKNGPLTEPEIRRQYEIVAESLSQLNRDGIELLPQTLPPFPWYFGGQLFANLFVRAEDTAAFCRENNVGLCFDICHSKLTANHENASFLKFCEQIGPYTRHLHVADASGVDGEGLQIGEGDMDFPAIVEVLDRLAPKASFIPEIWQGHKNDGEGFWIAAERLEGLF